LWTWFLSLTIFKNTFFILTLNCFSMFSSKRLKLFYRCKKTRNWNRIFTSAISFRLAGHARSRLFKSSVRTNFSKPSRFEINNWIPLCFCWKFKYLSIVRRYQRRRTFDFSILLYKIQELTLQIIYMNSKIYSSIADVFFSCASSSSLDVSSGRLRNTLDLPLGIGFGRSMISKFESCHFERKLVKRNLLGVGTGKDSWELKNENWKLPFWVDGWLLSNEDFSFDWSNS